MDAGDELAGVNIGGFDFIELNDGMSIRRTDAGDEHDGGDGQIGVREIGLFQRQAYMINLMTLEVRSQRDEIGSPDDDGIYEKHLLSGE